MWMKNSVDQEKLPSLEAIKMTLIYTVFKIVYRMLKKSYALSG